MPRVKCKRITIDWEIFNKKVYSATPEVLANFFLATVQLRTEREREKRGEELITYKQASPSSTNLQNYVNDCLLVDPKDRNSYIVGVCLSTPNTTFELDHLRDPPWSKGRFIKPSRKSLVKEVQRRGCATKGTSVV